MSQANPKPRRAARPRDAATLVLWRRRRGKLCVLMGQRNKGHRFMPETYVFPGGRLDRADYHVMPVRALSRRAMRGLQVAASANKARALALAAIRETFEETGLILGARDFSARRRKAPGDWQPYFDAGYRPDLGDLDYICRAITPPYRSMRFNARFFVADGRLAQGRIVGNGELEHIDWIPIDKAKSLPLPNITQFVLEDLAQALADRDSMPARRRMPFFRMEYGKRVFSYE